MNRSAAAFAEILVKIVEHRSAALDPLGIVLACQAKAADQMGNAAGLFPGEFRILEVDVVNDLADRGERRIVQTGLGQQDFERAAVALVGVLGLEHVETQLAGPRARSPCRGRT